MTQFALRRGFEQHVLGYTVHSLLVEMFKKDSPGSADVGDLDYSIGAALTHCGIAAH